MRRQARIVVGREDGAARPVARLLAEELRAATGLRLPVTTVGGATADGDIALVLRPADRALGDEGYRLTVDTSRVVLAARTPAGLSHGAQTLRQLLPPTRQPGPSHVPVVTIHDRPRFAWRGMMLDVARHFFGVTEIERLIDLLALYKLNRLHLHLTDDQGWRLAIRSRPRLTRVGSSTAVGGGPGGHFTQRDYRRVVAYAAARFVEVVPEIDMVRRPGRPQLGQGARGRGASRPDARDARPTAARARAGHRRHGRR